MPNNANKNPPPCLGAGKSNTLKRLQGVFVHNLLQGSGRFFQSGYFFII